MTVDRVLACLRKHPEWDDRRISKAVGAPLADVAAARKPAAKAAPKAAGISRTEFMALYDPTTKARNTLKAAVKLIERGQFYKDHELRKLAGCGDPALWRALANDPDEGFSKYQFRMGDQVWWSDPASVADLLAQHPKAKAVA